MAGVGGCLVLAAHFSGVLWIQMILCSLLCLQLIPDFFSFFLVMDYLVRGSWQLQLIRTVERSGR